MTFLRRVLVMEAGSELNDSLNINVYGFELIPDGAVVLPLAEFLHKQLHAAVLLKKVCVKTRT
jgi:hypothetical protein